MLSPSQVPRPHVVQGAEQAVPACGRVVGQPAAAGGVQLIVPADMHEQVPSGYRHVSCPLGAEAQFWPPDMASANEAAQPDGSVLGQSVSLDATVYQLP